MILGVFTITFLIAILVIGYIDINRDAKRTPITSMWKRLRATKKVKLCEKHSLLLRKGELALIDGNKCKRCKKGKKR